MSRKKNICQQCRAPLPRGANFCPGCGRARISEKEPTVQGSDPGKGQEKRVGKEQENENTLTWEVGIPLLTNPIMVKQFLLVVLGAGAMMAFLFTVIFAATGEFREIPVMLLISLATAGGLGLLLFLVALVVFGNRILCLSVPVRVPANGFLPGFTGPGLPGLFLLVRRQRADLAGPL